MTRREIFAGRVVRLVVDTIRRPDGTQATREIVLHPGAAAILPIDDDGRILLVKQYRHAVGDALWEIPAGKLEPGEPPLNCARRELLEETGYEASAWTPRLTFQTSPGFTDEAITLYVASKLKRTQPPCEGEIDRCAAFTRHELLRRIEDGSLTDAKTILAILLPGVDAMTR